ncbi:LysR family transcriptional regulator [Caulobacter sp. CCUG 60055]|uniref:LysR family transcriptional regulator n=1 Tax=Caulobacter sp. CCUG 60055 TaxID=2100090 RepID=UPI001FA73C04|nr:LysR family transcriptional regulator [Caulobacter sp. CCUG 60055]MCI3179655.1 LysR family transcriptional regulator [Caulobacter sp. CCUG 60055]
MIPNDHLAGVQAFVQAVEAGSFTLAGERLGLTRSAVGKAVARLERRLGARLLHRTTRSLAATEEGRLLYDAAVAALAGLEAAEAALAAAGGEPHGRVRLDLPELFGRRWVLPALFDLAARRPGLALDISFSNRVIDLAEDRVDLVVRIGEPGDSASLAARPLGRQETVLCAAPAYLDRRGRPQDLEALAGHDAILDLRDGGWRLIGEDGRLRRIDPPARLRLGGVDAAMQAAVAGCGVALVPRWLAAEAIAAGRLEAVLPGRTPPGPPIHALWPRAPHLPRRLRAVIDALVEAFTPAPPWERPPA